MSSSSTGTVHSEVGDHAGQDDLRDLARGNGLRLIGPNCIGVVNTATGLDATFSPFAPVPGRIAMQSQSGALGIALLERSARMVLGDGTQWRRRPGCASRSVVPRPEAGRPPTLRRCTGRARRDARRRLTG